MKKSKLLIPALSIASVGAVVAPMVTSCTNASEKGVITHETVKTVSGITGATNYDAKLKPVDQVKYKDQIALAKAYNDAINNNPTVFADDLMVAYTDYIKPATYAAYLPTSETVKISDAHVNGTFLYGEKLTSLVSFNFNVNQERDGDIWQLNYQLVNMPYTINFLDSTETKEPTFQSTLKYLISGQAPVIGSVLAFMISGFSINLSINVKDKTTSEVYTDISISIDDAMSLAQLCILAASEPAESPFLTALLNPLRLDVESNYFSKAIKA